MNATQRLPVTDVSLARMGDARLLPYRFRKVDGSWLISNDFGDHLFVDEAEFRRLLSGRLDEREPVWSRLEAGQFVVAALDRPALVARMSEKLQFLRTGPNLHIFVVTLRCNHTCEYCHASRTAMDDAASDMSIEVAERSVDFAFQTTSPSVLLEFQGGEPLANWPVVEHIIEYARQKNTIARKSLMFSLVSNLSLMNEERMEYLIDRRVQICTSIDGPAQLHDSVRHWKGGPSHDTTVAWMRRINARYLELGLEPGQYRVEALPTVTRQTLPHARTLIDHYVDLGCRSIFLRHLDPFGWAATTQARLGYDMRDFLLFYADAYEHILALNRGGTDFVERTAALIMAKVLGQLEPNFLDLRSPCGAGIGQVAYNHDGRMFTCDEGRMIDRAGDPCFLIGDVATSTYRETISGPVVRAMTLASTLQGQPHCSQCVYKPWCGVCPVHNYSEQGSLQGSMADSTWCQKYMGLFDFLMTRLHRADPFERALLQRWATPRAQTHFLQTIEAIGL